MLDHSLLNINLLAELSGDCPWGRELGNPLPGENHVPHDIGMETFCLSPVSRCNAGYSARLEPRAAQLTFPPS